MVIAGFHADPTVIAVLGLVLAFELAGKQAEPAFAVPADLVGIDLVIRCTHQLLFLLLLLLLLVPSFLLLYDPSGLMVNQTLVSAGVQARLKHALIAQNLFGHAWIREAQAGVDQGVEAHDAERYCLQDSLV